ncbi:MAG: hypothetical protein ABIL22_04320 [candidate division WOR-3 bacterium]
MFEENQAIEIARDFMKKQAFCSDYDLEKVEVHSAGDFWECWFVKKKPSRPMYGVVAVHKTTGQTLWRPSK